MRIIFMLIILSLVSACSNSSNYANNYVISQNSIKALTFDQGLLIMTNDLSDFIYKNFDYLPCFVIASQHEYSMHLAYSLESKGFAIKDISSCQNIIEFEFIQDSYNAVNLVANINDYMLTRYYQKSSFNYAPKTPFSMVKVQ